MLCAIAGIKAKRAFRRVNSLEVTCIELKRELLDAHEVLALQNEYIRELESDNDKLQLENSWLTLF